MQAFVTQGSLSILTHLEEHGMNRFGGSQLVLPVFLAGAPLELETKSEPLKRFLDDFKHHSVSGRQATVLKDYVVSIWVDCPGYFIPGDYTSKSCLDLLEDAVYQ